MRKLSFWFISLLCTTSAAQAQFLTSYGVQNVDLPPLEEVASPVGYDDVMRYRLTDTNALPVEIVSPISQSVSILDGPISEAGHSSASAVHSGGFLTDARVSVPLEEKFQHEKPQLENHDVLVQNSYRLTDMSDIGVLEYQALDHQEVVASQSYESEESSPVSFEADGMRYDEIQKIIQARGSVVLEQDGRVLRADAMDYDANQDRVLAEGSVEFADINGDIHRADRANFTDQMKNGTVRNITSTLSDGATFQADSGTRINGTKLVMEDASYTACEVCENKSPIWKISAGNVTHDQENRQVIYDDARFEVYDVPVMYLPYFSHADGSVDRQSGFLAPSGGYKSDLGIYVDGRYYWDIAPDQDATFGLQAFTEETPLAYGQWRKRWRDAVVEINGGVTNSARTDSESGKDIVQNAEMRGHVLANALWNINDLWRAGADVQWASDDQYMRQYDFIDKNVLTSDVYVERFKGRNYFTGHLTTFQDVRVRDEQVDQPEIAPELSLDLQGEPGAVPVLGGNWFVDSSFLGLRRDGDEGQDMDRLSVSAGWKRHFTSVTGLVSDLRISGQQDIYHARDLASATAGSGLSTESSEVRFIPQAHFVTRYPMVKPQSSGGHLLIEPIAAVTMAPNIDVTENIPNEDSQDVQIDIHNLFNADRFPGIDRVEDQSRVTYGMRTGWYGANSSDFRVFLGQSYRFNEDDNPFPEGSGLDQRSSDVVGEIASNIGDRYDLNYRFQLESRHLTSQRHEIDGSMDLGRFAISTQYLYTSALEGTEYDESREQLSSDMSYYWYPDWRQRIGFTQDLGEDSGLREAYLGLDYLGQCVSWALTGKRSLTDDSSGDSDFEVLFRIGLKSLGEFQTSEWNGKRD